MKKISLFCLIMLMLVASCSDDQSTPVGTIDDKKDYQTVSNARRDRLKAEFGKALASALFESPSLRKLIKEESLKMFDRDYDVLYYTIKDMNVSESKTVRQLLASYFTAESKLEEIERDLPLLTIFVPVLPEGTFSAKVWNVDTQVPLVGITSYKTNAVDIVDYAGNMRTLQSDEIPAFPVVVVKENERVIQAKSKHRYFAKGKSFRTKGNTDFIFLSDCFDGSLEISTDKGRSTTNPDQKLVDAYDIYNGTDGWHRDFVYYNITPQQDRGAFTYDYAEHIRSFKLIGDPESAYSKIADQTGDPKLKVGKKNAGWTGGFYEFKVRVLLNAKNGIGEELVTYFSAEPEELFNVEYEKIIFDIYKPKIVGLSTKSLSLPLFPWDLNDYASTVKIEIEEVDVVETIVTSESRTVKFATNFSIEGTLKKIGLKFGASLEETRTQSIQKTYTVGNDLLGAVIVNFADNVLISKSSVLGLTIWKSREYSTGWYSISVEPKRVQ